MSTEIHKQVETFADRLRSARKAKALGQTDLAEKAGVSGGSVGNWEIGPSQPRPENLGKLAAILEVTPAWLLYGEERKSLEVKDAPGPLARSEGSPHSWVEIGTLEKMLIDLATRLPKSSPQERKHILGNIADVVNELEARELSSSNRPSAEIHLVEIAGGKPGSKG